MADESLNPAVSSEIVSTLTGRKFVLVGFPPEEANLLASAFQETQSLSFSVDPLEAWPGSVEVKACDIIVLNLTAALQGSKWMDRNVIERNPKPLLLVGLEPEIQKQPVLENAA